MLLAGANAGDPWHGLWTDGSGLALPNETTMELPVDPVGGTGAWSSWDRQAVDEMIVGPKHGDCLLVKIPDVPVPTTSQAEEDAGMTWLNYALISGANRLLYGVEIGPTRWVYLDDDGTPWLVTALSSGSNVSSTTFRFVREFWFHHDGDEQFEEYEVGWAAGFRHDMFVLDASQTGRAMAYGYWVNLSPNQLVGGRCLSFSGTPGVDMTIAEIEVDLDFSDPDQIFTPGAGGGDPGHLNAGSYYSLGGCLNLPYLFMFDGDDAISVSMVQDFTATEWDYDTVDLHYIGTREFEGTLSLVTSFGQIDIEFTGTIDNPEEGVFESEIVTTYGTWAGIGGFPFIAVFRRASKVWEAVIPLEMTGDSLNMAGQGFSICLILPDRFETTGYEIDMSDPGDYRTYHPVTHELVESTSPVCFM